MIGFGSWLPERLTGYSGSGGRSAGSRRLAPNGTMRSPSIVSSHFDPSTGQGQ